MRKLFAVIALALCVGLGSCDKDDHKDSWSVPRPVVDTLYDMYPTAADVSWFRSGRYSVARFRTSQSGGSIQRRWAWFDASGTWYMTETDITLAQMPQAVRTAFAESDYASWEYEDGDWLERAGMVDIYVIEVEGSGNNRDTDVALYYTPDGRLVRTVFNPVGDYRYGDMLPDPLPSSVSAFIQSEYPAAQIVGSYFGQESSHVDILDEGVIRTLWFDSRNDWLRTETPVAQDELPDVVTRALAESEYASYTVQEVRFCNTAKGDYYRLTLRSGSRSVEVDITTDGVMTPAGSR